MVGRSAPSDSRGEVTQWCHSNFFSTGASASHSAWAVLGVTHERASPDDIYPIATPLAAHTDYRLQLLFPAFTLYLK